MSTSSPVLGFPENLQISFNGDSITETQKVRSLGVEMDRHMTFRPHTDLLTGRCTGILLGLGAARYWPPPRCIATMLVDCFVLSQLRYCVSVFCKASCETRVRIKKLVSFGARIVSGRGRREHISDAVRSLGWFSAAALYQYGAVTRCRAVLRTGEPLSLSANITIKPEMQNLKTRSPS